MNIYYKILVLIFAIIGFSACDEISKPYLQDSGTTPIDSNITRKVLIEDYTGFKCGNCPYAHEELERLMGIYSDNLIVIAVHCSFFANPDKTHTYDFRTQTGTEWDNFFGISNAGLPKGMVSRQGYKSSQNILSYDSWEQSITSALSNHAIVSLQLSAVMTGNTINIDVDYDYTDMLEEYHNLNVVIIEDSIVNYQKWYGHDPDDVEDYVHNHVLRAAVNGTWGEKLEVNTGTKSYQFTLPQGNDWRPEKLKVVAFISDVGNTYEIFQAEQTDVLLK